MRPMLLEWALASSLLILVAAALRALLGKRVSAGLRYALWMVVLVRLLVPVPLFSLPVPAALPVPDSEQFLNSVPSSAVRGPSAAEALKQPEFTRSPSNSGTAAAPSVTQAAPNANTGPLWPALGRLWLAGAVATAAVFVFSNINFARRLRRMRTPQKGVDCPLPLYIAQSLPSPCLFGLVRPAVYVTPETAADSVMLRHVLAHEYTHFRHGDHIWNVLRSIALAVHWWNPLAWLAVVLSRRDCELACDEGALKRLGDGERIAYGRTLLALLTKAPRPGGLLTCATTMTGGQNRVRERVTRIARPPRRWLWAAAVMVLVTALACVCAFGSAAEEPQKPGPADTPGVSSTPEPADASSIPVSEARPLPYTPDLNRNGVPEVLTVREVDSGAGQRLELWEDGTVIWSEEGYRAHLGWNALFLCTLDGEGYLLRYNPYIGQGFHTHSYTLFTLENGEETVVRENVVHFDINFNSPIHESFDPEAIAAFMDEVNPLLSHSVQLLNTDEELLDTFEKNGRLEDTLGWLDQWKAEFVRDESKSLLENLQAFQRAREGNEPANYRSVLLGERGFVYQDGAFPTWMDLSEVPALFDPYDSYMKIWSFAVADLDGDGTDEVVLYACGVSGDMGGYLVLFQRDGVIYGQKSGYRTFWALKTDGTFRYSYPGQEGFGRLDLDTGEVQPIAYEKGAPGQDYDVFWTDGQSSTEAAFRDAEVQQDTKQDAVWHEFTPENIAAALPF